MHTEHVLRLASVCPSYLLRGPQIRHKVIGVVSCVFSANRPNLLQCMYKWFDRNRALPVGLYRRLVDGTLHRHLQGTSATENDADPPVRLGQHSDCIAQQMFPDSHRLSDSWSRAGQRRRLRQRPCQRIAWAKRKQSRIRLRQKVRTLSSPR